MKIISRDLLIVLLITFIPSFCYTEEVLDRSYGLTEKTAIKVAGLAKSGPKSERAYLKMLRGPNGEIVKFQRIGSCCPFESPNSPLPFAMLDKYEISYEGLDKPIILYLNMYDKPKGELLPPAGFKLVKVGKEEKN